VANMSWRDEDKIYTENDMTVLRNENHRLRMVIRELEEENERLLSENKKLMENIKNL